MLEKPAVRSRMYTSMLSFLLMLTLLVVGLVAFSQAWTQEPEQSAASGNRQSDTAVISKQVIDSSWHIQAGCSDTPTPQPPYTGTPPAAASIDLRVAHCADDAYERVDTVDLLYDFDYVRIGARLDGTIPYMAGFLFRDVRIPQDAHITSAYLRLDPWGWQSGSPIQVDIVGELHAQAQDFNPANPFPHLRPRTRARVHWVIEETVTESMNSPQIASVIEEITTQTGWRPGNNLAIFIDATNDTVDYLDWKAYEFNPAVAAQLLVSYKVVATRTPTDTPTATPTPTSTPTPTATATPTQQPSRVLRVQVPLALRNYGPTSPPSQLCPNDPYEPNGTFDQAWGPLPLNADFLGYFNCSADTDRDFYFFDLVAPQQVVITLRDVPIGSDYDLTLFSCPAAGCQVGYSGNPGAVDERITIDGAAGRYYVRITRSQWSPLVSQAYRLRVATGAVFD